MDNRQLDKALSASALRQIQIQENSLSQDQIDQISPSSKFEIQMKKILAEGERHQKRLKVRKRLGKAAAVFAVVLTITFGYVLSANASHATFFQFCEKYFSISNQNNADKRAWDGDFNSQIISSVENAYLPTWMPNGFIATSSNQDKRGNCIINYKNRNNPKQFICLSQKKCTANTFSDNELKVLTKIVINNQIYYFGEKGRGITSNKLLVWAYNDRDFSLTSTESREILVKIASNLKFKKGG